MSVCLFHLLHLYRGLNWAVTGVALVCPLTGLLIDKPSSTCETALAVSHIEARQKELHTGEHIHTPEIGRKTAEDGGSEEVEVRLEVSHHSTVHLWILQHG